MDFHPDGLEESLRGLSPQGKPEAERGPLAFPLISSRLVFCGGPTRPSTTECTLAAVQRVLLLFFLPLRSPFIHQARVAGRPSYALRFHPRSR